MMEVAQQRMNLSARSYHRILRVARTIADLSHSPNIEITHLSEALSISTKDLIYIKKCLNNEAFF
jgi:magnesium chelatase family protein